MEWILNAAIIVFVCMELANVLIMYFKPDFKYGNSMAVFRRWAQSQSEEKTRLFVKYLVNWVANCKLIFIVLLVVVLIVADAMLKVYAIAAMILSIAIYFVSLHPIILKLDRMGEITPKGYSRTLALMIGGFMIMFGLALVLYFVLG